MPDVTELIDELIACNVPRGTAYRIAGRLMEIGASSAPYRRETVETVCDIVAERARRFMPKNLENQEVGRHDEQR